MRRELRELKGDEQAKTLYLEGMAKLRASGYLTALRALGRPTRHNSGKDPHQMASEASWSSGFNDCLDSLQHFQELYLEEAPANQAQIPDFGAVETALNQGNLTKEEANARKQSGEYARPDISKFTGNLTPPTRG